MPAVAHSNFHLMNAITVVDPGWFAQDSGPAARSAEEVFGVHILHDASRKAGPHVQGILQGICKPLSDRNINV
jgi:hypothetical protein